MEDVDERVEEPRFRVKKRRKVLRRRQTSISHDNSRPGADMIDQDVESDEELPNRGVARAHGKTAVKKKGITFSSNSEERRRGQGDDEKSLLPIVSADAAAPEDGVQVDRFVKPTGHVGVAEDKHMLAFVDKKLAEMRAATSPLPAASDDMDGPLSPSSESDAPVESMQYLEENGPQPPAALTTAQTLPTTQTSIQPTQNPRQRPRRRPRPGPDPTDVARDTLVDQILHESQSSVPHYDRSGGRTRRLKPHIRAQLENEKDGKEPDNDAAAANAFKAQLLSDLQNRRRRPPGPSSSSAASKPKKKTSHGPKLGGSRAQRQKMRALKRGEGADKK